jgi:hypothetical protein
MAPMILPSGNYAIPPLSSITVPSCCAGATPLGSASDLAASIRTPTVTVPLSAGLRDNIVSIHTTGVARAATAPSVDVTGGVTLQNHLNKPIEVRVNQAIQLPSAGPTRLQAVPPGSERVWRGRVLDVGLPSVVGGSISVFVVNRGPKGEYVVRDRSGAVVYDGDRMPKLVQKVLLMTAGLTAIYFDTSDYTADKAAAFLTSFRLQQRVLASGISVRSSNRNVSGCMATAGAREVRLSSKTGAIARADGTFESRVNLRATTKVSSPALRVVARTRELIEEFIDLLNTLLTRDMRGAPLGRIVARADAELRARRGLSGADLQVFLADEFGELQIALLECSSERALGPG